MADDVKLQIEMHRNLPSKQSDSVFGYAQGDGYGAVRVAPPGPRFFADEGTYFVAANATPGTGLAGHAAPTDVTSVLKPLVQIKNGTSPANRKRLYLHYIKLTVTAAGTGGTNVQFAEEIDTGTRYTSGGTQLTPLCPNYDADNPSSSDIVIFAGAVVAPAANTNREIGSGIVRTVIPVVGDTYLFLYGGEAPTPQSGVVISGTAVASIVVHRPPVILGPGHTFNHHQAQASQSAASSFEVEIAGWLR